MLQSTKYDYIIAGAGCAGLSLVMHILNSPSLAGSRILLIDHHPKKKNDRTWCFWEKNDGLFQRVVHKQWRQLEVCNEASCRLMDISPYTYKLIRGIDFYNYCFETVRNHPNISFLNEAASSIEPIPGGGAVTAGGQRYQARFIFNSIMPEPKRGNGVTWLLQHFKGWLVETPGDVFDPSVARLMDFRTRQDAGTCFFYVLPFSPRRALIEYTVFSGNVLREEDYDSALESYVSGLTGGAYSVIEVEKGIIPMTDFQFAERDGNIVYIGSAGGKTKGSSGYTFRFIQKHSAAIVASLEKSGHPFHARPDPARFRFYDHVLLSVLEKRFLPGAAVFTQLFEKNQPDRVLKFLDNETSLGEELKLISTLPFWPFLKAAMKK